MTELQRTLSAMSALALEALGVAIAVRPSGCVRFDLWLLELLRAEALRRAEGRRLLELEEPPALDAGELPVATGRLQAIVGDCLRPDEDETEQQSRAVELTLDFTLTLIDELLDAAALANVGGANAN